jgi:hypothetical protein
MHSFLVQIASIAVMLHMTLGCSWHHGLGTHACVNQCSAKARHHDDSAADHCCDGQHEHDCQRRPGPGPTFHDDGESHGHGHLACHDDGCNVTSLKKFVFSPLDFCTRYLDRAGSSALVAVQTLKGCEKNPFPDCEHTTTAVRAHLLFGILIL